MRTGLGLGLGLGLLSTLRATIALASVPATLTVGTLASITGTSNADGSTVTVTVNGETWGSAVVSGGAWSVTSTPTAAMVGASVAVVATVSGVSASGTTSVVHAIAITTLADIAYVGVTSEIVGTTTALDGAAISVTVGGETFGSTTASGGAWSVSAAPSALMVGGGVEVLATDGLGASASATTTVLAMSAVLDGRLGVTSVEATLSSVLTTWTTFGPISVSAGYTLSDDGTGGAAVRRINATAVAQTNHPISITVTVKPLALNWCRLSLDSGGVGNLVDLDGSTGNYVVSAGTATVSDVTAVSGGYQFTITWTPTSNTTIYWFLANSSGTYTSTLSSGQAAAVVTLDGIVQTRATDWADQERTTPLDFAQGTASLQPLYDATEGELVFDAVDDVMTTAADPLAGVGTAFTHFYLFKASTIATGKYIARDATTIGYYLQTITGGSLRTELTSGNYGDFAFSDTASYHVLTVRYEGAGSANADRLQVRLDGVAKTLSFTGTIPASLSTGSSAVPLGLASDMSVKQLRFASAALSASAIAAVEAELEALK